MKGMVSIFDVAKFILIKSRDAGDTTTNLKLQKLVYYAEAWFAALYGKKLTGEKFEAWVHGPVCRKLYGAYKRYGYGPIDLKESVKSPELPKRVEEHLKDVLDAYSRFSAWELERMSHQEEPWIKARAGCKPTESCAKAIEFEDMRDYFRRLADEARKK